MLLCCGFSDGDKGMAATSLPWSTRLTRHLSAVINKNGVILVSQMWTDTASQACISTLYEP